MINELAKSGMKYRKHLACCNALAFFAGVAFLAGCGGEQSATGNAARDADRRQASEETTDASAPEPTGPAYYVDALLNPCRQITEAVAQSLLNVREVVADASNRRQGSANPRCSYRDAEGLGRNVSVVAVMTPYETFNSTMPVDDLLALADLNYGQPSAPYKPADFGPGAQRFVAETDDSVTMFVMTGLGVAGGAYDAETMAAEAAFAVILQDPARTADERLSQARNLAMEYNSALINAAKPR
ncbi:hypothetical protein [Hyphococcus luteus]|nr:hypothetical protein [Marinicaulis flavus]